MVKADFEKLDVTEAPGWTLGVVDFLGKFLVVGIHVIILIRVKF